jgi:hypothetical protein
VSAPLRCAMHSMWVGGWVCSCMDGVCGCSGCRLQAAAFLCIHCRPQLPPPFPALRAACACLGTAPTCATQSSARWPQSAGAPRRVP